MEVTGQHQEYSTLLCCCFSDRVSHWPAPGAPGFIWGLGEAWKLDSGPRASVASTLLAEKTSPAEHDL